MTNSKPPQDLPGQGDIRIIGDRDSGKTTYLAALAYWPNQKQDSPIEQIEPFDSDTGELCQMAENLLTQGGEFEPTDNEDDPDDMPLYTLLIDLQRKFRLFNKNNLRIQLSCREYGGELFQDLTKSPTSRLQAYLDDCATASGLMILLDGKGRSKDVKYAKAFDVLREQLTMRLATNNQTTNNRRIALVLTKGEQGEVWSGRKNIPDYLKRKFPKTNKQLQDWSRKWGCPIEYFVCSAFGVIPGVNKPNVKSKNQGVILEPNFWRPFGLVSPIYWLYTGNIDKRLNDVP